MGEKGMEWGRASEEGLEEWKVGKTHIISSFALLSSDFSFSNKKGIKIKNGIIILNGNTYETCIYDKELKNVYNYINFYQYFFFRVYI